MGNSNTAKSNHGGSTGSSAAINRAATAKRKRRKAKTATVKLLNISIAFLFGVIVGPFIAGGVERFGGTAWTQMTLLNKRSPIQIDTEYADGSSTVTAAAIYDARPDVTTYLANHNDLRPSNLVASMEGMPWGSITLKILISPNNKNDNIKIKSIEPVVFEYSQLNPDLVVKREEAAGGGPLQRVFTLELENSTAKLMDKRSDQDETESTTPTGVLQLTGDAFTLSGNEMAQVFILIPEPDGRYKFGLNIHYEVNGVEGIYKVGTGELPLALVGGSAETMIEVDSSGAIMPID